MMGLLTAAGNGCYSVFLHEEETYFIVPRPWPGRCRKIVGFWDLDFADVDENEVCAVWANELGL